MHPEKLEENGYTKFECLLCDKYFEYKEAMNRHIQEHKGLEQFKCKYCDFKTTWKTSWQKHVRNLHQKKIDKEIKRRLKEEDDKLTALESRMQ